MFLLLMHLMLSLHLGMAEIQLCLQGAQLRRQLLLGFRREEEAGMVPREGLNKKEREKEGIRTGERRTSKERTSENLLGVFLQKKSQRSRTLPKKRSTLTTDEWHQLMNHIFSRKRSGGRRQPMWRRQGQRHIMGSPGCLPR